MSTTLNQLIEWLAVPSESEHLEFKEARNHFDFDRLLRYCCALANEGGGNLVLGVTNQPPRRVVGSQAFPNLETIRRDLYQRLHFRVETEEFSHPDGRVLVFHVPSRTIGQPVRVDRVYWMRAGESLTEMSEDRLKQIFAEGQPDFSRRICEGASETDLDPQAVEHFRHRWILKSKNQGLKNRPKVQLLNDAELMQESRVTYAALILFGSRVSLGRWLPNAEVVFEYRSHEASITNQQRENFREGLFLIYDRVWDLVNRRNDRQHYRDGLFVFDIPTFNEDVVREALLNAICHRDYQLQGSIFFRQFPTRFECISPGGFPEGITPENCLYKQAPRNRTIAEALERCGLVERSGQGFDRIFSLCIRESKPLPDFSGTDAYQVCLKLDGGIQDPGFIKFLEKVGAEVTRIFYVDDLLVLNHLRQDQPIPDNLSPRLQALREAGIVELLSRGRGARYILSQKYYDFSGKKGAYTRKRGLDRETNKELLLQHLRNHKKGTIREFEEVLPTLKRTQIHSLLMELKGEGRIVRSGGRKLGHWELALSSTNET